MMRQIVLDTETTGLGASRNRIIEIACVELLDGLPTGSHFHAYLNPQQPSHPGARAIHGLTCEFLSDKPLFEDIVHAFCEYIQGAELLIHNARFDTSFLDAELARAGRPALHEHVGKITDTLAIARRLFPGLPNSLDALCMRYRISLEEREFHGALLDANLLAQVFFRMTRDDNARK